MSKPGHAPLSSSAFGALPSQGYARYVLAIMVIMYTCNYLDRYVLAVLVGDIKEDLQLSDAAIGFMLGPAFAIFYTGMCVPSARCADT